MRRREYVTTVGSGVGVLAAGRVGQDRGGSLERVLPTGRTTAVRPGGEVVFEAAADPGVEPGAVEWRVDGADGVDLAPHAPFWSYARRTGNPAAHGRFDDPGQYEVSASVDGTTLAWSVEVSAGAPAPPIGSLATEPGPDETVTTRATIDVTATARDDGGALGRVVWQEGRNATYVDRSGLSGSEATATYAVAAGHAVWFIGGYPMNAWIVCEDGRTSVARTDGPSIEAMRDVTITGTNAPVRAGETLVVDASIRIDGHSTYHSFVVAEPVLIVGHDPTRVDSDRVEVFAGRTKSTTLEFATASVRNTQTFPVRVETRHAASETDVTVVGTDDAGAHGTLEVTGLETNAPVTGGDRLEVSASLANAADDPASRRVELVVGDEPTTVDSRRVLVDAGETAAVGLGYETYPVRTDDEFPVRVATGDDTASRSILVFGRDDGGSGDGGDGGDDGTGSPSVSVSITGTNAPVTGGERLSVTAAIENAGPDAGTRTVELVVGRTPEVVDSASVTLASGETETVSLGYETYPVATDDVFPVTVRSAQTSDTRTVTVRGTGG